MHEIRTLVMLHELAHLWLGDLVTMKWWDDLWLNESFGEYCGTLAAAGSNPVHRGLDDLCQPP